MASITGKRIVVTGAGGSIGSYLCMQLAQAGVEELKLVCLTEASLYRIQRKLERLGTQTKIHSILGSVCERKLMDDVCQNMDIVIHAAAHKHVPICEENPLAAIENNVSGTMSVAVAAANNNVDQFILVSTDKAVRPKSIMGATKRVAEIIVHECGQSKGNTIFSVVRFGNVMDSDGSVLPLWRKQIADGGPLTLTDERCARYFMSITQACALIFSATEMERAGTFIFDMGEPKLLIDLAWQLINESNKKCKIKITGLRPGEKLTEELHYGGTPERTKHPKIFYMPPDKKSPYYAMIDDMLNAVACRNTIKATEYLRIVASC